MTLTHDSRTLVTFTLEAGSDAARAASRLRATLHATQPCGYRQRVQAIAVHARESTVSATFRYPMIDDGRYDPPAGVARPKLWIMGEYQFRLVLTDGDTAIAEETLIVDPHDYFPRNHKNVMAIDASTQCLSCAPRQSLYFDEREAAIVLSIRRHRVSGAHVAVDVTRPEGTVPLAGPWRFTLDDRPLEHRFSIDGWEDGEYWVRVRMLEAGRPIGAFCVRKFWVQRPTERPRPQTLELGGVPEVLVDDYCFEVVEGMRFLPAAIDNAPGPMIASTEPHENRGLYVESIDWNPERERYESVYRNALETWEDAPTGASRAGLRMLAVSPDGVRWEKPSLGRVAYAGSTGNNILRDETGDPTTADGRLAADLATATFRFYDAGRDGAVDLNGVFVAGRRGPFPFDAPGLDAARQRGFDPQPGEDWPFWRRGDEYLVLSREPLLYSGQGMDLRHTTESIRASVELVDGSIRRLLFYFRPASPSYPPHDADWDNQPMSLRCLAVMWTDDGLTYHRRFVIGPDACDPIGTEFYSMGFLQEFGTHGDLDGRPVIDMTNAKINHSFRRRNLYLGSTLLHWGVPQTQAPELIWTRDFINFHRFRERRRSLVPLGEGGSFDAGMVRERYRYWELDGWWWYYYTGINTRHNGYGIMARHPSLEDAREKVWNQRRAPYFSTWEGHFADGKATAYLPGLARMRPYRMAFAEPADVRGRLVTAPVRVGQTRLHLNAETEPDGSIVWEVVDGDANVVRGPGTFRGDDAGAEVADLSGLVGQTVRVRFTVERARLYAFLL
jgi:hypothetical protein